MRLDLEPEEIEALAMAARLTRLRDRVGMQPSRPILQRALVKLEAAEDRAHRARLAALRAP